jgi:DNA polymerase-3 subunit beta
MKIQIQSHLLRDAINKLTTVVDRKSSRPILSNCLIKSQDGKIEIIGSDLEVSAKIVLACDVIESGQVCLNTKNFSDILRELPNQEMTFENRANNTLNILCGNISYDLVIVSSEDFPHLVFSKKTAEFKLRSKNLSQIIDMISHAISTDETRLYLNGIYLQNIEGKLRSVAIDGHRLALLDTPEFLTENKNLMDGVIIPRKGVNELKKLADSFPGEELVFSLDDSSLYVCKEEEYYLSIRLISREYPKYQSAIPDKTTYQFQIDRNALFNAVKRIKILSNEKTNGIKFSLKSQGLIVSANHPSLGLATEKLEVEYTGKDIDIGFNAKYLMDTLSVMDDGSEVQFEFNNEIRAVVLKSQEKPHFLGIIMPLKL